MPASSEIPSVEVTDVAELIAGGAELIDIREQNEWDEARIPGAELKPMSAINDWYQGLPRDHTVVLYCRSGQRSAQAVHALVTQAGFENVLNMTGGIIAWADAELPMEN
ncbi:MAG: rhodanese-like domain-containing protein [Acidimicrobiia bacterium]